MLSILIPVFNEADILECSVERVHSYLDARGLKHEILVVSNGSTDATNLVGAALAQKLPWFRFFTLSERSVGRAFSKAAAEAASEFLVSLDIDLSFDLRFMDYAHDLLQYADMVVGSKTMGKQRRSPLRVLASQTYITFAQLLFGITISDYSIGCKAYRRSSILPALPQISAWTGYPLELILFLKQRGNRIIQVGVDCDDRRKSHFNLLHEGFFRYAHVFHCWRALRSGRSWMNQEVP